MRRKHVSKESLQLTGYQLVINLCEKRCLIGLQKGVSKSSKGHLLEANWAFFQMLLMPF